MAAFASHTREYFLANAVLRVEFRSSHLAASDPAETSFTVVGQTLIKTEYATMATKDIVVHHFSWSILCDWIANQFGEAFDPNDHQIGCFVDSPTPRLAKKFFAITDELTFHNALGYLSNDQALSYRQEPIAIIVWSPKPLDGPFQKSRLAPTPDLSDPEPSSILAGRRRASDPIVNQTSPPRAGGQNPTDGDDETLYGGSPRPNPLNDISAELVPTVDRPLQTSDEVTIPPKEVVSLSPERSDAAKNKDMATPSNAASLPPAPSTMSILPSRSPSLLTEESTSPPKSAPPPSIPSLPTVAKPTSSSKPRSLPAAAQRESTSSQKATPPTSASPTQPKSRSALSRKPEAKSSTQEGKSIRGKQPSRSRVEDEESDGDEGEELDLAKFQKMANARAKAMEFAAPNPEDFDTTEEFQQALNEYNEYLQNLNAGAVIDVMDSTVCMHLDETLWRLTCALFHHQSALRHPVYCVALPDFRRQLLPVQAHGVYWSLRMIHGDEGSLFLAHIMGIGKTTQVIAVVFVQHRLNMMWSDIEKAPGQHWDGRAGSSACPSAEAMLDRYGFDCPCHPSSPTHFIKKRLGVNILLCPTGLLGVWLREWIACEPRLPARKKGTTGRKMEIFLAHGDNKHEADERRKFFPKLQGEEVEMEVTVKDHQRGDIVLPGPSVYLPRLENGEVIVLSTVDSINDHFYKPMLKNNSVVKAITQPGRIVNAGRPSEYTKTVPPKDHVVYPHSCCFINLVAKDECQLRRRQSHAAIEGAKKYQADVDLNAKDPDAVIKTQPVALMLLSGTPMTAGPKDLAKYIDLMKRESWANHKVLSNWMGLQMTNRGDEWEKLIRLRTNIETKQRKLDDIVTAITPLIETLFLRVTTESTFLDQPVVIVPKVGWLDGLTVKHPGEWDAVANNIAAEEMAEFRQREEKRRRAWMREHRTEKGYVPLKTTSNLYYKSRLAASIPKLAPFSRNHGLTLTQTEWKDQGWAFTGPDQKHPYIGVIDELLSSSGKFAAIGATLDWFEKHMDRKGIVSKHVFTSAHHTSAYLLKEYLIRERGATEKDIVFLTKLMPQSKINKELERFTGNYEGVEATARFIITTNYCCSVGLTLTQAVSVIFLEPDFRPDIMQQGWNRHRRQGSKYAKVYCGLCLAKGNAVEEKIMENNQLKEQLNAALTRKHPRSGPSQSNTTRGAMSSLASSSGDTAGNPIQLESNGNSADEA